MSDSYSLQNLSVELPRTLQRYIEAQYHIWDSSLVDERRQLLAEEGVISRAPFIEAIAWARSRAAMPLSTYTSSRN